MEVDPSKVHRLFYPQVPLVLAAQMSERVSAMPVVSYLWLSDSPPLVAVSCTPRTFTYRLCVKARAFSLSVLDASRLSSVEALARVRGGEVKDKLHEVGLNHYPGKKANVPVIEGSLATVECSLHSNKRLGDHALLTGKVRACYADAFDNSWTFDRYTPILYTGWKDGMTTYSPR